MALDNGNIDDVIESIPGNPWKILYGAEPAGSRERHYSTKRPYVASGEDEPWRIMAFQQEWSPKALYEKSKKSTDPRGASRVAQDLLMYYMEIKELIYLGIKGDKLDIDKGIQLVCDYWEKPVLLTKALQMEILGRTL